MIWMFLGVCGSFVERAVGTTIMFRICFCACFWTVVLSAIASLTSLCQSFKIFSIPAIVSKVFPSVFGSLEICSNKRSTSS